MNQQRKSRSKGLGASSRQAVPRSARGGVASSEAARTKPAYLIALVVALIVLPALVFSAIIHFDFVKWDDPEHLSQNPFYQPTPFAHISHFWTHSYYGDYIPLSRTVWAMLAGVSAAPNGQPVTTFDPSTYHAANLCLHIANVLLVFFILRFFVKKDWAAALGALLFAIHPLQVEPVAWVSGLRDLLCAFFSFACLLLYLLAIRGETSDAKGSWWLAGAFVCYVLALLSKSSAAVLPFLCLFLDTLMSGRVPRRRLVILALWILPAIGMGLVTRHIEQTGGDTFRIVPFWQRPFVAGDTIGFYLWKLFVPHPLGVDYGRTPTLVMSHAWAYLPILVPIALIILAWRYWKRAPWLAAGIGIFLISLAPVSGIVPFVFQFYSTVADRYIYFAMLGPALIFAMTLSFVPWRAAVAAGAVVVLCLGYLTVRQIPVWANTTTLFTQALRVNQQSALAYSFLGVEADQAGQVDLAEGDFRKAVTLNPLDTVSHFNLSNTLIKQWLAGGQQPGEAGLLADARGQLLFTLRMNPHYEPAHHDLGYVSYQLNRLPEAIAACRQAEAEAPGDPRNNYLLALIYRRAGDKPDAQASMGQAAAMGYPLAVQMLNRPMESWK